VSKSIRPLAEKKEGQHCGIRIAERRKGRYLIPLCALRRDSGLIFSALFGIRRERRSKTNRAHLRACVPRHASLARYGPTSIRPCVQSAARGGVGFPSRADKPS